MKATTLFGGVQIFSILITIMRSKFIAILLGPIGMGIASLFNESINLVSAFTNLGLSSSAVKSIAEANSTGDIEKVADIVTIFNKLVFITGTFGFVIMLVFSSQLSELAFGNKNYTWSFAALSITLLLGQVSTGNTVVLQGMRQLNYQAKAGIFAAISSLIVSIPLFYLLGKDGIVLSIILTAISTLIITNLFARKLFIKKKKNEVHVFILESKKMIGLGLMLSLSSLMTIGSSYLVRIYINRSGGIADVGLYNAGLAIINSYVGMIFTAMATDYYPRLSEVAHDKEAYSNEINQQAEIALLVLAPILCVFLIFIKFAILILYSEKFLLVNQMIHWAALGVFFKAASWSVGFLLLAKGASKIFFWNELLANSYAFGLNLIGYHYFGLTGLGISFFVSYFLHLLQLVILTKMLYGFSFKTNFINIFICQFTLGLTCFLLFKTATELLTYVIGSIIILMSSYYSFNEIDKRLGVKYLFQNLKSKFVQK